MQGIAKKHLSDSGEFNRIMIKQIAEDSNSDIIIFGDYSYNSKTELVSIQTKIYLLANNLIVQLPKINSYEKKGTVN